MHSMATLIIRKLDDSIKQSLRVRAARQGVSMEEEAKRILRMALTPEKQTKLGSRIHRHFAQAGGVDEDILPARSTPRSAPDFSLTQDS